MAETNLFSLEPLLIARIQAAAPTLATVGSASLLASTTDVTTLTPAVFVIPDTALANTRAPKGQDVLESQRWMVKLYVTHALDPADVETAAKQAGAFLLPIYRALQNWEPSAWHTPVQLVERIVPVFNSGYGEFAVICSTDVIVPDYIDPTTLDSFLSVNQKHDIDTTQDGEPLAEDDINLPQ